MRTVHRAMSGWSLDAYDVLGINLDASSEEVKKAYKRMSLMYHPDKAASLGVSGTELTEKFNEIKEASEILGDAERRKAYDTFGFDLGEDRLEVEVWTLGTNVLWNPIVAVFMPTIISRIVFWIVGWRLIFGLVVLLGLVYAIMYALNFTYGGHAMWDPELTGIHGCVLAAILVVIFHWVWPPLSDAMVIMYLVSELVGVEALLFYSWRITAGASTVSLLVAWLIQGRWLWIIGIEFLLGIVMLIALAVATGIMKLWLDGVHDKCAEKVQRWRVNMREERKRLNAEVVALRRQVREAGLS